MGRPVTDPELGSRIRGLREARRWTQKELAQKVGISRAAITQIESGKTKNYRHDTLVGLAHAFGVTVQQLLTVTPLHIAEQQEKYSARGGGAITREEEVLLEKYRHLAPDDRARLQAIVSALDATDADRTGNDG